MKIFEASWYPLISNVYWIINKKDQKGVICIINPLQLPNLYFSFKRWPFFYFPRDPTLSTFVASVQQAHVDGWDMMPKHHRTKWPFLAPATLLQQEGGITGSPLWLQIAMKLRAADSINYMESYNHFRNDIVQLAQCSFSAKSSSLQAAVAFCKAAGWNVGRIAQSKSAVLHTCHIYDGGIGVVSVKKSNHSKSILGWRIWRHFYLYVERFKIKDQKQNFLEIEMLDSDKFDIIPLTVILWLQQIEYE